MLGCIAMFAWEYIAYTALPLSFTGFRKLPNETAVLAALHILSTRNPRLYARVRGEIESRAINVIEVV